MKTEVSYKVKDKEGNVFVFSHYENGIPVYRTNSGCKHIFESDLKYYEVIEQDK